jgi:GNAT superfamily N-acetyltransferase
MAGLRRRRLGRRLMLHDRCGRPGTATFESTAAQPRVRSTLADTHLSVSPLIREASEDDADSLVDLLGQLGYPSGADEIRERLRAITRFASAHAWVADEAGLVGLITCHMLPSVHASEPVALMTTLVVESTRRGQGVGRALLEVAEAWARENGAVRISLTSGSQRDDAHAFYERVGYERSGVRFTKALAGASRVASPP